MQGAANRKILVYYGVEKRFADIKEWYDGYHFGHVDVYCPWDVLNQCYRLCANADAKMDSHWENSSSNAIIQDMIEDVTETTKAEIETLISGECVEKLLIPELTYTDLDSQDVEIRQTYLWSELFATGYLTDSKETGGGYHRLLIPNKEVLGIYEPRSWTPQGRCLSRRKGFRNHHQPIRHIKEACPCEAAAD